MTPELLKAIEQSQEVFITTYDPSGKPGTVPVWFDHNQGNFYVSTYADSMKCQKIRQNPSVKLTWVTRDGPSITGTAEIVSQREILGGLRQSTTASTQMGRGIRWTIW